MQDYEDKLIDEIRELEKKLGGSVNLVDLSGLSDEEGRALMREKFPDLNLSLHDDGLPCDDGHLECASEPSDVLALSDMCGEAGSSLYLETPGDSVHLNRAKMKQLGLFLLSYAENFGLDK